MKGAGMATRHAGTLHIDLGALIDHDRALGHRIGNARVAAVVEADAYGLGASVVASARAAAGYQPGSSGHWHVAAWPVDARTRPGRYRHRRIPRRDAHDSRTKNKPLKRVGMANTGTATVLRRSNGQLA